MKPTQIFTLLCLVTAGLAAAQLRPPPPGPAEDWNSWLARAAGDFSGVALVARNGAIETQMAFGLAGTGAGRLNHLETRFNLGSINKTFTAIGIAQLIEKGRLALDDRLIKHLPAYPNSDAARRITIRQLLRHTSGVAQFMRPDFGDVNVEQMMQIVAAEPLAFDPGTRQMYSNGGYVILGRIIEVVAGRSYADYVGDEIYRPAGMTDSGFVRAGERTDLIALPVGLGSEPPAPRPGNPAGGGYSTAADLARFAHALQSGRLLGAAMTKYVLDGTFAEEPKWGFALREQVVGGRRFVGNGGGAPGVNAEFRLDPASGHVVVVLSNSSPPAATNLLTTILNRIAGVPSSAASAQSDAASPVKIPPTPLRAEVGALHQQMIAAFQKDPASVATFHDRQPVIRSSRESS